MKSVIALVASLAAVSGAFAGDLENIIPLYNPFQAMQMLGDPKVKNELRISADQDKSVKATLKQFDKLTSKDNDTKFKMKGTDKERFAQTRALDTRRSEQLFQMLGSVLRPEQTKRLKQMMAQSLGMRLFDHSEVRDMLGLSAEKAAELHAIFKQLRDQSVKDFLDKKITRAEGQKRYSALGNIVPEEVQAALTGSQRRMLEDLLGEPFRR